jgi:hypothetical protein
MGYPRVEDDLSTVGEAPMRRRTIAAAALIVTVLVARSAPGAGPTCEPAFEHTSDRRTLPHVVHDQAEESIEALYPDRVVLVSRRAARIGGVTYALLAYMQQPSDGVVHVTGAAVHHPDAWTFDMTCPSGEIADGLVSLLERISALERPPGTVPQPEATPATEVPPQGLKVAFSLGPLTEDDVYLPKYPGEIPFKISLDVDQQERGIHFRERSARVYPGDTVSRVEDVGGDHELRWKVTLSADGSEAEAVVLLLGANEIVLSESVSMELPPRPE